MHAIDCERWPRWKRTEMQQFLKCLTNEKYTYITRLIFGTQTVSDIFWAQLNLIKLFNTFLTVVVMDSTYKTNIYGHPLFEFVGVTSIEMMFSIGFTFMTSEKEDNFVELQGIYHGLALAKNHGPR
jgi:histone-lysine N-methyltransferase SETD2